jgi:hypothetical protein
MADFPQTTEQLDEHIDTYIHVFGGGNIWMNNDSRTMSGYRDVTFGGVDNFLFLGTYMDSNRPSWLCEPYYR